MSASKRIVMQAAAFLAALVVYFVATVAMAQAPTLGDWLRTLKRPIDGVSCCGEGDGVYADLWRAGGEGFILVTVTGSGSLNHSWAPIGRTYRIPQALVVHDHGNPSAHAWLFLNPNTLEPICFVFGGAV